MFSLTVKESIILFAKKYYSQIDVFAMGSPLRPTLTNIFLCYHESNWLKDYPKDFTPVYYKKVCGWVMWMIFLFGLQGWTNFFLGA